MRKGRTAATLVTPTIGESILKLQFCHDVLSPADKVCTPMLLRGLLLTHTHTHPFKGPFSGTTRVSRYQKGKTNLDFTEAGDSEWQWHQLGHMQVCT